jgi:hypothetical protein
MATLAFLVAACLDPVQAALVLVFVVAYRGYQPILVAGAAAALVTETTMALAASGYVWGELIAPRLVAALIQAAVSLLAVRIVRGLARSAGGVMGFGRLSSGARTAALEALESPSAPRRIAPWHVRSYVRRHFCRLRRRKNTSYDCESR